MTDIEYRVSDLINFSSEQKPIDFEQAFSDIITDKIQNALNDKKLEVAQSMFGSEEPEEYYEDGEDA